VPAETHVESGPIGPEEVERILRERLAEILEIEESTITLDLLGTDGSALDVGLSRHGLPPSRE